MIYSRIRGSDCALGNIPEAFKKDVIKVNGRIQYVVFIFMSESPNSCN